MPATLPIVRKLGCVGGTEIVRDRSIVEAWEDVAVGEQSVHCAGVRRCAERAVRGVVRGGEQADDLGGDRQLYRRAAGVERESRREL